jgi:hypothetical protein
MDWLTTEEYWLQPVENNPEQAQCKVCKKVLVSELSVLKTHANSDSHKKNVRATNNIQPSLLNFLQKILNHKLN